ncbi:MAG: isoprenyl transferase [Eubacterium sp.]|nr:isoprenyl transferase [Eubacterium sp.]
MSVPKHIAIIMDGNGRWAKKRGLPRNAGHTAGAKNVEKICLAAKKLGIKYLTLYAFSTENWMRPEAEVKALMKLLSGYLDKCVQTAHENKMHLRVIGDISRLDPKFQEQILEAERISSVYDDLHLTIAINYGSRDEILRAMRKVGTAIRDKELTPEEITEETFQQYLDTKDLPDPDLLIRTSGEQRLSNYLLWQLAYSEFYFTDVAWPEFDEEELKKALNVFENRDRRYGGIKEE